MFSCCIAYELNTRSNVRIIEELNTHSMISTLSGKGQGWTVLKYTLTSSVKDLY